MTAVVIRQLSKNGTTQSTGMTNHPGQLDLFESLQPRTCGHCVHRNANPDDLQGHCAPVGYRMRDDAPCGMWFGLTQLRSPSYGRAA